MRWLGRAQTRKVKATTPQRRWDDTHGAISVEYLIAFLPVMFLFGTAWQTAHLYAGHLITHRAASAAGRAASVVLVDDPAYYGNTDVGSYSGPRKRQIVRAAEIVLSASPRMLDQTQVSVENDGATVTATVRAAYRCFPSFGLMLCGFGGVRTITASASYPYHLASYTYD